MDPHTEPFSGEQGTIDVGQSTPELFDQEFLWQLGLVRSMSDCGVDT